MGRIEDRVVEEERSQREFDAERQGRAQKAIKAANQIIPSAGRLLVRAEATSNPSSTLHVPEMARNMSLMGTIVAAGADTSYSKDQRVIVGAFTGVKFEINGVPHMICRDDEIQGVIVGDEIQALAQEA